MKSNILIDWITFSSKMHDVRGMIEFLGLAGVEWKKCSGRYYYGEGWRFGHITIYSEGLSADMGICVEMSGQGCRDFESFGTGDWESIFRLYVYRPSLVNISRLDVAYDDFDRLLDLDLLIRDTFAGNYVSKNKHWNIQKGSRGRLWSMEIAVAVCILGYMTRRQSAGAMILNIGRGVKCRCVTSCREASCRR